MIKDLLKGIGVDPESVQIIDASNPEEMFAKLAEALKPEDEPLMTSEQALDLAIGFQVSSIKDFQRGHTKRASWKQASAGVWVEIHRALVEQERREEQRRAMEELKQASHGRDWGDVQTTNR